MKNKVFWTIVLTLIWVQNALAGEYTQARFPSLEKEISLQDVTRYALANSLDIQIAKLDAYISRTELARSYSLFDTFLNASINYANDETKQSSSFSGTKSNVRTYSLGLEKKLPTGTKLSFDAQEQRTWSDSAFVTDNPLTESSVGVSLAQSLGKNFFGLADRADIKITKLDIENAEFTSLGEIELTLAQIQIALGDFEEALDNLETLLAIPSQVTTWMLKLDPVYDPVRDHPRFQKNLGT